MVTFAIGDQAQILAGSSRAGEPGDTVTIIEYYDDRNITAQNTRTGAIGNKYARNLQLITKGPSMLNKAVDKVKYLKMDEADRALFDQNYMDIDGNPTGEGQMLADRLSWQNGKAELAKTALEINKLDKERSKK